MSISAANSAGLLNVYLCPWAWANQTFISRNLGTLGRRSFGGDTSSTRSVICFDFREPSADENFVLKRVCRLVSRLMLSHCFGAFPAPGGTRSSASRRPSGFRFLPKQIRSKTGTERRANFFRFPPKKQTFGTWEPGPLPWLRHV